jgi:hypothetical protein
MMSQKHTIHFLINSKINFINEKSLKKKCKRLYRSDCLDVDLFSSFFPVLKNVLLFVYLNRLQLVVVVRQFDVGKASADSVGYWFQCCLHQGDPDLSIITTC